jgi:hypothetical protein
MKIVKNCLFYYDLSYKFKECCDFDTCREHCRGARVRGCRTMVQALTKPLNNDNYKALSLEILAGKMLFNPFPKYQIIEGSAHEDSLLLNHDIMLFIDFASMLSLFLRTPRDTLADKQGLTSDLDGSGLQPLIPRSGRHIAKATIQMSH